MNTHKQSYVMHRDKVLHIFNLTSHGSWLMARIFYVSSGCGNEVQSILLLHRIGVRCRCMGPLSCIISEPQVRTQSKGQRAPKPPVRLRASEMKTASRDIKEVVSKGDFFFFTGSSTTFSGIYLTGVRGQHKFPRWHITANRTKDALSTGNSQENRESRDDH